MKHEYVVAKLESKNVLLRVDHIEENGELVCTIEKTRHREPESVTIKKKEVVARLGSDPAYGKVHGVTVETWKKEVSHLHFGTIDFFHLLPTEHEGRLLRAFDKVGNKLKSEGLNKFLPVNVEVRYPSGKMAGKYRYTGKDREGHPDTLYAYPKEEHEFTHLVFHEAAHGIWFRLFRNPKGRAAWVRAYHSYVTVTELTDSDIQNVIDAYLKNDRPSDAKGQMSEEETSTFEAMLEYVKRVHSLTVKDLDTLFDSQDDLSKYWPTTAETTIKEYEITEYAMKSPEELFAESFAFMMTGKKLPSKIQKLMEKSLSSAANSVCF
jgi:hypothetical protein